jgi:hypothetical protein
MPAAKFQIDGDLTVSLMAATADHLPQVALESPQARVRFDGARGPPIELRDVAGALFSSSGDVTESWSFAGGKGTLTAAVEELRSIADVPGARTLPLLFKRGRAEAHLDFTAKERGPIEGSLAAYARELEVCQERGLCFWAPNLNLSGNGFFGSGTRPGGRFRLDAWGVRLGSVPACPSTKVGAIAIQGRVVAPPRGPLEGDVEGRLERVAFTWGSFRLVSPSAGFSAKREKDRLSGDIHAASLAMTNSGGPPKSWEARVATTRVRADLRVSGKGVRGPAYAEMQRVTGQVGDTGVEGDVVASLDLKSNGPSNVTGEVSGAVQARSVAFRTAQNEIRDYWADVDLRAMKVDARQNLDLAGPVEARFQNVLPALYVLASKNEIPRWAPRLLPRHTLTIDLDVHRVCHWTDVQIVEARHGPLRVSGRLQVQPGDTRGALLFRLGRFLPISLGLEFAGDYSRGTTFAGSDWLEKRLVALTRAAEVKRAEKCPPETPTCD